MSHAQLDAIVAASVDCCNEDEQAALQGGPLSSFRRSAPPAERLGWIDACRYWIG